MKSHGEFKKTRYKTCNFFTWILFRTFTGSCLIIKMEEETEFNEEFFENLEIASQIVMIEDKELLKELAKV